MAGIFYDEIKNRIVAFKMCSIQNGTRTRFLLDKVGICGTI